MPRWLRLLGKWALTAALGAALWFTVDVAAVSEALHGARWSWIGLALLLLPLNVALDGWVWSRLLRRGAGPFPTRQLGAALLCGFTLGIWTPARLGEYAGRAFCLPDADPWTVSLSVFAQRMIDMLVGVAAGLLALLGAVQAGWIPLSAAWQAAAATGAVTAAGLGAAVLCPGRTAAWVAPLARWVPGLSSRISYFRQLRPRDGLPALAGTVLRYFVFTGQFVCLTLALAPGLPPLSVFVAVVLTFYAKYLIPSLTLLDLGIREGGAVLFFEIAGLPPAVGLSAALLLFVINVLLPAAAGLPFIWRLSLPRRRSRPDPSPPGSVLAET
ncbi:MAG: lysylphosphatidylglycerol synthase transmembrane domain-containing protein [Salinivenus sp.]